jgi:hypothetical protein
VALLLSKVPNAEEATALAREAARRLGVDATQLWIEAQQLQGARGRGRLDRPADTQATSSGGAKAWPPPSLSERDLMLLLLHMEEARVTLLPYLEEEDLAHPGLRALLGALRQAPAGIAPEALMAELPGEAERGLLAALLMEQASEADLHNQVTEWQKRYDIRRRKKQIRELSLAITQAQAQAKGDPVIASLESELRKLQDQARAVRGMVTER